MHQLGAGMPASGFHVSEPITAQVAAGAEAPAPGPPRTSDSRFFEQPHEKTRSSKRDVALCRATREGALVKAIVQRRHGGPVAKVRLEGLPS